MIRVTPNEYLDARQPTWLDAEVMGVVRYDDEARLIEIGDAARVIQQMIRPS